jgi:hypothetical protein
MNETVEPPDTDDHGEYICPKCSCRLNGPSKLIRLGSHLNQAFMLQLIVLKILWKKLNEI